MSDDAPVFKGELTNIESVDIEAPLSEASAKTCAYFTSVYSKFAESSKSAGDEFKAHVFQFLATLTSFHPNYTDIVNPYNPMWQLEGKRSLIPSDLHPDDFVATRALANKATDPALRARLFDVLWIGEHNHLDCQEAVTSYLEAAEILDNDEHWVHSTEMYRRAFQLAKVLGWKKPPYQSAEKQLLEAINRNKDTETEYRTCKLLKIAKEFHCGDRESLADIARSIGDRADESNDHRKAREYWTLEAIYKSNDPTASNKAKLRAAETYVTEAEQRAGYSYFAAASFLKDGIEALRRANGDASRIAELRTRLAEYQRKSVDELQPFEHKIDISDSVNAAREHVSGHTLIDALKFFVCGLPLIDLEQLKSDVLKQIKEFPLSKMFKTTLMDDQGRTRVEKEGIDFSGDAEGQIENNMFEEFAQTHVSLKAQAFINPAREQIYNDHHPQFEDLIFLVTNNPFVPPSHEGVFLRGIHAGLCGDFLVAAHLLVPQIENSIRYVLISNGIEPSNLLSDGTQPLKILGSLFDLEATRKIFGEPLCFELRGLLIEKTGCDFRNRLAHGFVTESECHDHASVYIWWLVMKICFLPLLNESTPIEENDE